MNILFINPESPDTSWSFKNLSLLFSKKKASGPPLDLLTFAAMFTGDWECKLTDLNIDKLRDSDIRWADYVFINSTALQADSADRLVDRCQANGKRIIAAGEHFTDNYEMYNHIDHLLLNDTESTLSKFLEGYEANWPWRLYRSDRFADIKESPVPDYSLINTRKYSQLSIRYSRTISRCGESPDISVPETV